RLHHARFLLVRAVPLQPRLLAGHGQHQRQVATGRVAPGADVFGIEVVILGVRPQPADGALAIFQGRWERRLSRQAVIDRPGNEPEGWEILDVAGDAVLPRGEAGLVPFDPAAAVDEDDAGPRLAAQVFLHGQVHHPGPARSLAVAEVMEHGDVRRGRAVVRR